MDDGLVCCIFGDRKINDYSILLDAIKQSGFKIKKVISGNAKGADALGEQFATQNKLPLEVFEAEWDDLEAEGAVVKVNGWGKAYNAMAGFNRNQKMAEVADCGIGLQTNGDTNGTQDMKKRLEKLGKKVFILGQGDDDRIQF